MNPPRIDASTRASRRALGPVHDGASAPFKEAVRREARALGFDSIGFAAAGESRYASRIREWIDSGCHGTMAWMARDPHRRTDPRAVLQGVRTVIAVSASYYRGGWPSSEDGALRGHIARYAWGRDYHKRIRSKLRALARALARLHPGCRVIAYVDTGPVLDRAWSEEAGLGWIGKNTNVIRKGAGSWFFLGELLTDLEIEPDTRASNHCGTCTRCIQACPTGAIVGPNRLDARRCISYLTIEHRGPIPVELRSSIGTRIFGCDDCQEVCPWNRFAVPTQNPDFAERPGQQTPELIPLLFLDEGAFRARFQGTALLRARRVGFVRNVAVALGNLRDARAVEPLGGSLAGDPDALVRGHAAWALGRIGGPAARSALERARATESDAEVRSEIDAAIHELEGTHAETNGATLPRHAPVLTSNTHEGEILT